VVEQKDRLSVLLRGALREVCEGAFDVGGCAERAARLGVEAQYCFRDGTLERARRTFFRTGELAVSSGVCARGARQGGCPHPHRNQEKRDRGKAEDCASPQAASSYIQVTS
jgi:hypothetical protein